MSKLKKLFMGGVFALLLSSFIGFNQPKTMVATSAWSGPQTSTEGSYFASVGAEEGSALATKLKSIIAAPINRSYDWSRYEAADEAEGVSDSVLLIYSRKVVKKTAHVSGSTGWNREHSYPQSKISGDAAKDNHHIFADDNKTNNARGSKLFGVVAETAANQVKDGYGNKTDNYTNSTYFMPNPQARGEVARATMYVNTLYGDSVTDNFASVALMLKWHIENPVSNREIYRNNIVHTLQKNRNPFIDHPEYACRIWGSTNSETQTLCANTDPVPVTSVSVSPTSGTINLLSSNKSLQLTATVAPSNADVKTVNWTTSNASVATVSNTGNVTAHAVGQATITATSTADGTKKASATITVVSQETPVTGVTLNTNEFTLNKGNSQQLVATVSPTTATNKNVTWSSSNSAVATVTNGLVKAIDVGVATIKVTTEDGHKEASAIVIVKEAQTSEGETVKYTFTNKSWVGNPTGWTSIEEAFGFIADRGMQVTSNNKAVGNSPYFENIIKVIVGTAANSSKGAGTYSARLVDSATAMEGSGSQIGTPITVSKPGADIIDREFVLANPQSGHVQVIMSATENSLYIRYITIVTAGSVTEDPLSDANLWADFFLESTASGCEDMSASALSSVWPSVKSNFMDLSVDAKNIIKGATANGDGSDIENAVARYILIVQKYDLEDFVFDGAISNKQRNNAPGLMTDTRYILPLIMLASVFTASVIVTTLYKKKNNQ